MFKIYFSYYQAKDGFIKNLVRWLLFTRLLLQAMNDFDITGGSLTRQTGIWEGKREPSFVLEIGDVSIKQVRDLSHQLKQVFNQDSIMIVEGQKVLFV